MSAPHTCNILCCPPAGARAHAEHAELVYTSRPVDAAEVAQAYGVRLGWRVLRVEPAAEAGPYARIPPEQRAAVLGATDHAGTHAYVVWFSAA